jgi:hypothetical protein
MDQTQIVARHKTCSVSDFGKNPIPSQHVVFRRDLQIKGFARRAWKKLGKGKRIPTITPLRREGDLVKEMGINRYRHVLK